MASMTERFREVFLYEPETGRLLWRSGKKGRGCIEGREAGSIRADGRYRTVVLDGKRHYIHRIAWTLANGEIPDGFCIDHIDGSGLNNRLANLRLTTLSGNQRNRKINKGARIGIHGLVQHRGGYSVYCASKYLKWTKDFFEACCIRKAAENENGFHPNHGKRS